MSTILNIAAFIFVLGLILLFHEAGHLFFAKLFNVYCSEFSFGMGPLIYQFKGKETKYSLRAIPLGGYVAMAGEDGHETASDIPKERTIRGIATYKRVIIMFMGAGMNFVLAWLLFFSISLTTPVSNLNSNRIDHINPSTPAEQVLEKNDQIVGVVEDSKLLKLNSIGELSAYIQEHHGQLTLRVLRQQQAIDVDLVPAMTQDSQGKAFYYLGIQAAPYRASFFGNFEYANQQFVKSSKLVFNTLIQLFSNPVKNAEGLSGPVGIFSVVSSTAKQGIIPLMFLTALFSVNIGIFNLLPIPILDGGRIILEIYSGLTKKPINKKVENGLLILGVLFMVTLLVVATWNDIGRLISGVLGG